MTFLNKIQTKLRVFTKHPEKKNIFFIKKDIPITIWLYFWKFWMMNT